MQTVTLERALDVLPIRARCVLPPLPRRDWSPIGGTVLAERIDFAGIRALLEAGTRVVFVNALGRDYSGACQIEGSHRWWCGSVPDTMTFIPNTSILGTLHNWLFFPQVTLPAERDVVVAYCAHRR